MSMGIGTAFSVKSACSGEDVSLAYSPTEETDKTRNTQSLNLGNLP